MVNFLLMPENFIQYLIIFLILLLFGREYIPAVLNKFGIAVKKNGNGNGRIADLEKHASVANSEMSEVKESLIALNVKMDIIMKHLKL